MSLRTPVIALLPSLFWACSGVSPNPIIQAVSPTQAYTDRMTTFTLSGSSFVPASTLDPATGRRELDMTQFTGRLGDGVKWAPLSGFTWQSTWSMSVQLAKADAHQLGPGFYRLEITDPRGERAAYGRPIELLGYDTTPPTITLLSPAPGDQFAPGSSIPLRIEVTDPSPGVLLEVIWRLSTEAGEGFGEECRPVEESETLRCNVDRTIPANWPPTRLTLQIQAFDQGGEHRPATMTRKFDLLPLPSVVALEPAQGSTLGGTEVILRGISLVKGTRAFLNGIPLSPEGGIWVDDQTLTGRTPPNAKGKAGLTIVSPLGERTIPAAFDYRPPPVPLTIVPDSGTPGQTVKILGTGFTAGSRVLFGPSLLDSFPLLESSLERDTAIIGKVPAGKGRQTVWVYDPEFGYTSLPSGFLFMTP